MTLPSRQPGITRGQLAAAFGQPSSAADRIEIARKAAAVRLAALADEIRQACPGPHNPVQHRDRKPPWCEACGYAEDGIRIHARLAAQNDTEGS